MWAGGQGSIIDGRGRRAFLGGGVYVRCFPGWIVPGAGVYVYESVEGKGGLCLQDGRERGRVASACKTEGKGERRVDALRSLLAMLMHDTLFGFFCCSPFDVSSVLRSMIHSCLKLIKPQDNECKVPTVWHGGVC